MGNHNSGLRRPLEEEFSRLTTQGRKYLLLDQLLQLRLPPSAWMLDPSHLGVLFALDRARCGRIYLDDLLALAEAVRSRMRCYQPHEFQTQMQGYCTLQMWRATALEGEHAICRWLLLVFSSAGKTCRFEDDGEVFLHEEGVRLLFVMFKVEETQGVQFADYLNLLQKAGEDTGMMDLENPEQVLIYPNLVPIDVEWGIKRSTSQVRTVQDQWVPLAIVSKLLMALVTGMSKVMEEIYPREELSLVQ